MEHDCLIINVEDEYEITIQVNNVLITGIYYLGMDEKDVNTKKKVRIEFFDSIEIIESKNHTKAIERVGKSFSYIITGVLDIDNALIHSVLDFELNPNILFDYSYLDKKYIKLKVLRIDFSFE